MAVRPIDQLKAILILPGTVLVVVPGIILLTTRDVHVGWGFSGAAAAAPIAVGAVLVAAGAALGAWTGRLFATRGQGTPAPWNPPQRLVVAGPYRHVRNPMITGAATAVLGEAVLLGSLWLLGWWAVFLVGNHFYFMLSEEPALQRRFGEDYRLYKRNVPRWIPRPTPWDLPDGT